MNTKKKSLLKGDWLFGTNGYITFVLVTAAVLFLCFYDQYHSGPKLIPTYYKHVIVNCLIYSVLALGLNFVTGYIGQTSLGHAVFFGLGAYATGALTKMYGVNFWVSIPIAMLICCIAAIPLALASLRVKSSFLIVVTYAFCEIFRYVALNTEKWGGTNGMPGIPSPTLFGMKMKKIGPTSKDGFLLVLFVIVVLLAFFTWRIKRSRIGYAFAAIREDEIAAVAMGINVKYYKTLALLISAAICAVAGSFYAAFAGLAVPALFESTVSISILTMVIIGGRRNIMGVILGAFLMTIMPEVFHNAQEVLHLGFDPWMILYGLLLIFMMRFRPQGIWPEKTRTDSVTD